MQFLPSTSVNKIEYLHFLKPLKPNAQEADLKKTPFLRYKFSSKRSKSVLGVNILFVCKESDFKHVNTVRKKWKHR
jgi:hypothetical protein